MPTPSENWNTVPVRGHYMGTDGKAIIGTVTFTPQSSRFIDGAAKTTVIGRSHTVEIDPDTGLLETTLGATDDTDISGTGFTWQVRENFPNGVTSNIVVPLAAAGAGIELSDAVSVPPDLGTDASDWAGLFQSYVDQANAAVAGVQDTADAAAASADDAAAAAASVNREANNGVAGLDATGKLTSMARLPAAAQRETNNGVAGLDAAGKLTGMNRLPDAAQREANNGVAGLDAGGKLISSRLPVVAQREVTNGVVGIGADGKMADETRLPDRLSSTNVPSKTATENKWTGVQIVKSVSQRDGNKIDFTHDSIHPSSRPRSSYFSGSSHPLSEYFTTLANAQVLYPFATSLTNESDWAAMQLAVNSTTSYPRGWVSGSDWRQYGTGRLLLPIGVIAMINKPITKAANQNKNYRIGSETSQGARIDYTGGDGGRIFDFDKDSVGSVLMIENLVLNGGGIRLKGAYRGDIRVGSGCLAVDAPHPAIMTVDSDHATNQVGVVGIVVENFYTDGCAGGVWLTSSTATISTVRDCRFLTNTDIGMLIDGNTDILVENVDFTGMAYDKAITGDYPYLQISAQLDSCSNVDVRDIRFGSEVMPVGVTPTTSEPPMDYVVIGPTNGNAGFAPTAGGAAATLGYIKFRKLAFRTPPPDQVTSTLGRVAINMKAPCQLDIDDCDFGEFNQCLIDESWVRGGTTNYTTTYHRWGDKNYIDAGHNGPIFSDGGVSWVTPSRLPTTISRTVGADPGDGENLATTTDLSNAVWLKTSCTVGAAATGGPNGTQYHSLTRTTTGACIIRKTVALTAGDKTCFGIFGRKGTIRNFRMRVAQVGGSAVVLVDQRDNRMDSDWNMYWWRVPPIPTTGNYDFSFYIDDDAETGVGGTMDACLPFVSKGWIPRPPRTGMRLTTFRAAPATPVTGMHYLADGTVWDPKTRGLARPYEVMYDGAGYEDVSGGGGATLTPPQLDVFTASGTWTKPVGAVRCEVICIGAGSGGGSGRRGAAASVRAGGGGGGGGMRFIGTFAAADLGSTEVVTVGTGGTGGTAQSVDSTTGVDGNAGGVSSFGSTTNRWVGTAAPGGGSGGAAGATTGGLAGAPGGSVGAAGSTTGLAGGTANNAGGRATSLTGGAGGAGGGISAADAESAGGTGGNGMTGAQVASVGGTAPGGAGANGNAIRANSLMCGGGGAGGGSSKTTAGGAGGNGAAPGGGGGGGGASLNGFNSGAGGNGADGAVYVRTYFS